MASNTKQAATADSEYGQAFPDWVYQIPGLLLILAGFGGVLFVSLT